MRIMDNRMKLLILMCAMTIALLLGGCIIDTPTPPATLTEEGEEATPEADETPIAGPTVGVLPTTPARATPTPRLASVGGRSVKQYGEPPLLTIDPNARYTATIRTSNGAFTVDLYASQAPMTVNSFVFLAQDRFYDGLIFHRVIEGFMIQGGDPAGNGSAGPGYQFGDEIVPELVFDGPGILAMANRGVNTSTNGSQFFVTVAPTPHLDGNHTIFGRVTNGQEVVDAISKTRTGPSDRPLQNVVIQSIDITKSGG